jgi:hypothetical protein
LEGICWGNTSKGGKIIIKMIQQTILLTLISSLFLYSCDHSTNKPTTTNTLIDTLKSIKIDKQWVTPKKTLELNSELNSSGDTLCIVTCTEYVFSPFGLLKDKSDIKTSLLNNFTMTDRIDTMDIGPFEFQILKHNSSRLILFFDNDPEASKHSYIFKGEINDSDVNFLDNVKIGMSKTEFYNTFFYNFPAELQNKYKTVVFISGIEDIKHFYSFNQSKLISVNFITNSYWKVNY